jgi:hypothetical protein
MFYYKAVYTYPALFEEFWSNYPRKIEKVSCWITWEKLNKIHQQEIVIASKNFAEAMKEEGREIKYIKYPKAFINPKKQIWKDYLEPVKKEKTWLEDKLNNKGG